MITYCNQCQRQTRKHIDEGRKERWKEHFEEILNRDIPKYPIEISEENYPEVETIYINPITKEEVNGAIK